MNGMKWIHAHFIECNTKSWIMHTLIRIIPFGLRASAITCANASTNNNNIKPEKISHAILHMCVCSRHLSTHTHTPACTHWWLVYSDKIAFCTHSIIIRVHYTYTHLYFVFIHLHDVCVREFVSLHQIHVYNYKLLPPITGNEVPFNWRNEWKRGRRKRPPSTHSPSQVKCLAKSI